MSIDMFKMERGTYVLHPEPVNALAVARQIADGMAKTALKKALSFDFTVDRRPAETASAFRVSAEEPLLYTLLSNLIRNAVEASPDEGRVSLSFTPGANGLIAIHNAGVIPESIRARFFQKYATSGKRGGTGLGAYSAQLFARTLGGTIDFRTSEQEGTTITVSLPLAR
jgi:signal transduction histidine kinase